jgi:hypothetical protein
MKKQNAFAPGSKLAFSKEKVANLSPADLDQIHGGEIEGGHGGSSHSTHNNFSCCACTTIIGIAEQE